MMQRYIKYETYTTPFNGGRRGMRRHRLEDPLTGFAMPSMRPSSFHLFNPVLQLPFILLLHIVGTYQIHLPVILPVTPRIVA